VLPSLPEFSGDPGAVANAVLNFSMAWGAVLLAIYKTAAFLYDKLLQAVFEKIKAV